MGADSLARTWRGLLARHPYLPEMRLTALIVSGAETAGDTLLPRVAGVDIVRCNVLIVALMWGVLLLANLAAIPLRRLLRRAGARMGVAVDPRAVALGQALLLIVAGFAAGLDTFWILILAVSAAGFRLLTDRFALAPQVRLTGPRAMLTQGAVARLIVVFLLVAIFEGGGLYWVMTTLAGISPGAAVAVVGALLLIVALSMWQGAMNATRRHR